MIETTEQYLARGGQITPCPKYASIDLIPKHELEEIRQRCQLDRHKERAREYYRNVRRKS